MLLLVALYIILIGKSTNAIDSPGIPAFDKENGLYWSFYLLAVCLMGPFSEEIFFRGLLLQEYRQCCRVVTQARTITGPAGIFFLFHILFGNFNIHILLLGIGAGILAYYTRSLLYSFILHCIFNTAAVLAASGILQVDFSNLNNPFLQDYLFIMISGVLIIIFFGLFVRYMKERDNPEPGESPNDEPSCATTSNRE
jgi:membrane protease YdiL (CAAX protease family)